MKNIKFFNTYLFISTFSRNILDIYSVVFLYQKGMSFHTIIGLYAIIYFLGSIISSLSIKIGNRIGYKYILFLSTIVSAIAFCLIKTSQNPYLIAISLSLSIFTYHPIRHYYGMTLLNEKKKISSSLILSYLASFLASYAVIKDFNLIYLVIITAIGLIPTIFIKSAPSRKISKTAILSKNKILFYIFDQFKILFLLLEPLYLYTISKKISFVGVFNIIITFSSIICLYLISKKSILHKSYPFINIFFVIVLLVKLNITNQTFLLLIAILEGMGIKINELISTMNLYSNIKESEKERYLITSEQIFCLTRAIIFSTIYLCNIELTITMYLLLIGVFFLSFQYHPNLSQK